MNEVADKLQKRIVKYTKLTTKSNVNVHFASFLTEVIGTPFSFSF